MVVVLLLVGLLVVLLLVVVVVVVVVDSLFSTVESFGFSSSFVGTSLPNGISSSSSSSPASSFLVSIGSNNAKLLPDLFVLLLFAMDTVELPIALVDTK